MFFKQAILTVVQQYEYYKENNQLLKFLHLVGTKTDPEIEVTTANGENGEDLEEDDDDTNANAADDKDDGTWDDVSDDEEYE